MVGGSLCNGKDEERFKVEMGELLLEMEFLRMVDGKDTP